MSWKEEDSKEEDSKVIRWKEEDSKVIREMIFKENEMLNFRITWLVTLQGLLFAALGFAWKDGKELIPALSWVGIISSIAAGPPLYYAHHAIKLLRGCWNKHRPLNYAGPPVIGHYHSGNYYDSGGKPRDMYIDKFLSMISIWWTLPVLFFMVWAFILLKFG